MSCLLRRCSVLVLILCNVVIAQQRLANGEYVTKFEFKPEGAADRVSVAGDFNNWSTDANPLKRGDDGVWRGEVPIAEGIHHYKFVVNGSQWITDPRGDNSLEEDDNYGGKNSGIMVGVDARKLPPPKAGEVNRNGVLFNPADV